MTTFRRPLGDVAIRLVELAATREVTSLDAAASLQLSRRHASVTTYNLAQAGYLEEVDRRMVDGARRPVPVYRAAEAPAAPEPSLLILDWPRG